METTEPEVTDSNPVPEQEEELELTPENLRKVMSSTKKMLLVISKDDCPPCEYYERVVAEAEKQIGADVGTLTVKLGEDASSMFLTEDLKVQSVPTAIVVLDGQEKKRVVPSMDFDKDVEELRKSFVGDV